jgi:hypothetical protein
VIVVICGDNSLSKGRETENKDIEKMKRLQSQQFQTSQDSIAPTLDRE